MIAHDIPAGRIEPDLQPKLVEMARGLDHLGRAIPGSTEPVLDEGSLRQFLQQHMPNLANAVITEAQNHKGSRLGQGGGTPINWPELAGRLPSAPFSSSPEATLASYGLSLQSSTDDVRQTISDRIPNFEPRAIYDRLNALSTQAAEDAGVVSPEFSVAGFWSCMWNKFGWWAIGMVIVVAGAFLAAFNPVTATIAWGVFWFWFWMGFALDTLVTILNCLLTS